MSEKNVEIVRGHIEAFRQGDPPARFPTSIPMWCGTRVGLASSTSPWPMATKSSARRSGTTSEPFEDYDFVAQRFTDLGSGGAVLALLSEEGRGKSSGAPVRQYVAALYTVIDGKIARITFFPSEAQALEAAGLTE